MPHNKKVNVANKLHKPCAHPRSDRLIELVKDAAVNDNELLTLLDQYKVVVIHVNVTRNQLSVL